MPSYQWMAHFCENFKNKTNQSKIYCL
jgi:hypothetical protein